MLEIFVIVHSQINTSPRINRWSQNHAPKVPQETKKNTARGIATNHAEGATPTGGGASIYVAPRIQTRKEAERCPETPDQVVRHMLIL